MLECYETELFDRYNGEGYKTELEFEANMFDTLEPEYELTCTDCQDDECTGHCMSCSYDAQ